MRRTVVAGPIMLGSVPGGPAPVEFPSQLRAEGQTLVDEADAVVAGPGQPFKGFNIHPAGWSQGTYDSLYAEGVRILRAIVRWDDYETVEGVPTAGRIAALDQHIERAEAAGIYTMIDWHMMDGAYPTWVAVQGMTGLLADGNFLTTYLANRYGNPSGAKYTKAVLGMGVNEPPTDASVNGWTGTLASQQSTWTGWIRAEAPDWIAFIGMAWAQGTPMHVSGDSVRTDFIALSPTAFDSIGGNWVLDLHDYFLRDTRGTTGNEDGRQYNGMTYAVANGGYMHGVGAENYSSAAYLIAQHQSFMRPYKTFCQANDVPLMVGEWGWPEEGRTGEVAYIQDHIAGWTDANSAIEVHWNYDVTTNTVLNPFASHPGGPARAAVAEWLAS